ncbi:hypothetical protein ACXR0O_06970 [Verrucomicrobiota bacterium sgz303538]
MKPVAVLLALFCLLGSAFAEPLEATAVERTAGITQQLPGVELAQGISQITGTAVSPLLGVTSIGAWRYFRSPAAERARLPWFCQPPAWCVGFVLLGLCFLKDLLGTAAPTLIKKPLDLVELFENKLSAIIAGSAVIPILAAELVRQSQAAGAGPSAALPPDIHFAAVPFLVGAPAAVTTVLAAVLAVGGFLLVWLACHAINVLIALSPFTMVDSALKMVKAGLLTLVTAGALVNPWIGVAVCMVILLVAGLIAPWAFRLTVFGTVFATDVFRFRFFGQATQSALSEPAGFTARPFAGVPVRTLGRLIRPGEGQLAFQYRPWLVLSPRMVSLPAGTFALSKGLLCPVMMHREEPGDRSRSVFQLLPRYCSQESTIATHLGIDNVQDGGVRKGLKAVRVWLLDTLGFGRRRLVEG